MSYSIRARGATVASALAALAAAFDNQVLANQAIHARDRDAALGTAKAMTDQLGVQPEGFEVEIQLHGSLGWSGSFDEKTPNEGFRVTSANVGSTAYYAVPERVA